LVTAVIGLSGSRLPSLRRTNAATSERSKKRNNANERSETMPFVDLVIWWARGGQMPQPSDLWRLGCLPERSIKHNPGINGISRDSQSIRQV
jgi:hypothetical protein